MKLEVALVPRLAENLEHKICIVIDVLRATTTLVTSFERGCHRVILANDLAEARLLKESFPEALLAGENGGIPPEDFQFGNSPADLAVAELTAQELIFTTSNGTRALNAVSAAPLVLAGCLRNATAVVHRAWLAAQSINGELLIVPSGREGAHSAALDDLFTAGFLVELVRRHAGGMSRGWMPDGDFPELQAEVRASGHEPEFYLDETAVIAHRLYTSYTRDNARPTLAEILTVFSESGNGLGLSHLGLSRDIDYSAMIDTSAVVPYLRKEIDGTLAMVV